MEDIFQPVKDVFSGVKDNAAEFEKAQKVQSIGIISIAGLMLINIIIQLVKK